MAETITSPQTGPASCGRRGPPLAGELVGSDVEDQVGSEGEPLFWPRLQKAPAVTGAKRELACGLSGCGGDEYRGNARACE
jgi:hypothetical protein